MTKTICPQCGTEVSVNVGGELVNHDVSPTSLEVCPMSGHYLAGSDSLDDDEIQNEE
mgnify:CR=1 FL=1